MAFDIASAKPISSGSGFDMSSARPADQQYSETGLNLAKEDAAGDTSFIQNLAKDVKGIAKGIVPATGQAAAIAGKAGLDVLTGASVRDLMGHGRQSGPVASLINEPTIRDLVKSTQVQAIAEEPKYSSIGAIRKTMYEHPLTNIPAQAALLAVPAIAGRVTALKAPPEFSVIKSPVRGMKVVEPAPPKPPAQMAPAATDLIDTAEVLPTSLEKTNVQNIATNQYVRDNLKNFAGKQAAEMGYDAAEATKSVKPAIREAQNKFYKNLGIKDTDPIDVNLALAKVQNEVINQTGYLDEAVIKKATAIYDDFAKNTDAKTNTIPFGKLKEITNKIYDLAEDNVNDMGRKTSTGKFFTRIGNALTEAKKSDPRIAKASGQYTDLMDAERLINKTLRLNREMGEMRLESKINSSFRDKGQLTFKENLRQLEEILRKHPETRDLVKYGGFTDKIKMAQIANDIMAKKTVTPVGMGRIPGVKMIGNLLKLGDPGFHAQLLAKGVEKGRINASALAGKSKNYPGLIAGPAKTRAMAMRDILKKGAN